MARRLVRDESGMTMGLVVIMIVLIGVMGAGLLTFVRRDLEGVVQVNQGQRALEFSDAGIEAARKHLADADAAATRYNGDPADGESEWSGDGVSTGKQLDFDGDGTNDIRVGVRYLRPSTTAAQAGKPDNAPQVLPAGAASYPGGKNYFKITARGTASNAARQAQAIYFTETINLPTAFYATRDIDFGGNPTINGVSFFAGRCMENFDPANISNPDPAYGNWAVNPPGSASPGPNRYNSVPRATNIAGVAALGGGTPGDCDAASGIEYEPKGEDSDQKAGTKGTRQVYGRRDYDRNSASISVDNPPKSFGDNTWGSASNPTSGQPTDVVTFPFGRGATTSDDQAIERLRQRAQEQGHHITWNPTTEGTLDVNDDVGPGTPTRALFPTDSNASTVYFVEFSTSPQGGPVTGPKGRADFDVTTPDGLSEGTVVVVNGDLNPRGGSGDTFQGVFIVRDPDDTDDNTAGGVMNYDATGGPRLNGYVNVEGDMKLAGEVNPLPPGILAGGIPGLYTTQLWSWRECYTANCD